MTENFVPRFTRANGFHCSEAKSIAMRRIKANGNLSELLIRKFLWHLGIRYRCNDKRLPGKPDIVISKARLVIFIDGEFWHGHNWEQKKDLIKSNREYWIPKIEMNIRRDKITTTLLQRSGWTVLRFWEQEVKKEFGSCIYKIISYMSLGLMEEWEGCLPFDEQFD